LHLTIKRYFYVFESFLALEEKNILRSRMAKNNNNAFQEKNSSLCIQMALHNESIEWPGQTTFLQRVSPTTHYIKCACVCTNITFIISFKWSSKDFSSYWRTWTKLKARRKVYTILGSLNLLFKLTANVYPLSC